MLNSALLVGFLKLELVSIRRNPEVATQPLFFGKIEDVAYEKSTLLDLS